MQRKLQLLTGFLACFLCLTSFSPTDSSDHSLVAISVKTKGLLQSGYGIKMTLTNLETHEATRSKAMGLSSSHSIFHELEPGKYRVSKVEIPLGDLVYINQSRELADFFGTLEFKAGQKYYLGNFIGNREIGRKDVFHLKLRDEDIPEKLLKKLQKKEDNVDEDDFTKMFPYKADVLTVY